jgi:Protein of unknown function (DUF1549)/Protein of unknown function (DUF1553)/Planctomycete cytochrome C
MARPSAPLRPVPPYRTRILVVAISAIAIQNGLSADEPPRSSKKNDSAIDFAHDVAPIFQKRCAKCHTGTQKKGGFSLNTRQTLLAGGDGGAVVVSGKSGESELIARVSSQDADLRMPPEGERLSPSQIDTLKKWIDRGVSWEEGFAFGKATRQAPIEPRRPPLPDGPETLDNPVDRFLGAYLAEHRVDASRTVSDRVFARRVHFDLVGLPPTPADLAAFDADTSPRKHQRLVDRLLDDRPAYAAHWLTFWNDLLRNAYHGTGFIDGGRRQITGWLYGALSSNKPYDRFVHELIAPVAGGGSDGFIYGIKWRGTVNESQRREIQAAQSVSQVFLGTNLKCASCHDSFVNHWKLTDAYALASVFSDTPLELHRCDQPTGVPSTIGFLYPQIGQIDAQATREARVRQLADLLVNPRNGRLARTIVNRLWARLFGQGLVEPIDNLDAEPWHQDLLDYLAADLADHGYDLQRTLRLLAGSRAYRMPGVGDGVNAAESGGFVFRGPLVKRLLAEQFVDAVFSLTSTWPAADPTLMKLDGRGQGGQLGAIAAVLDSGPKKGPAIDGPPLARAQWVWTHPEARRAAPPETVFLRRIWKLDGKPSRAVATLTADNAFELFVNGQSLAKSDNWNAPVQVDVTAALIAGDNVIALSATNGGSTPNSAGAIAEIATISSEGKRLETLSTDASWHVAGNAPAEWTRADFDARGWKPASVLGDGTIGPWNVAELIKQGAVVSRHNAQLPEGFRVRASLLPLDSLQAALGRPNREQVVSSRDTVPTMLQALELTNGTPLGSTLQRGAMVWRRRLDVERRSLVDELFLSALSRLPSDEERRVSAELIGAPPSIEGIEDLLWTLCMHPDFQLIP